MPQVLENIDKICRDKGRDVLYLEFDKKVFSDPDINKWTENTFFLTISNDPQVIGKYGLSETDLNKIRQYVIKNKQVLLDHWDMKISSAGLVEGLKK